MSDVDDRWVANAEEHGKMNSKIDVLDERSKWHSRMLWFILAGIIASPFIEKYVLPNIGRG